MQTAHPGREAEEHNQRAGRDLQDEQQVDRHDADADGATSTSMLIKGLPTAMLEPWAACRVATRPANGVGTSTMAFSVEISAIGWSTVTTSPSATSHRLISPSVSCLCS